MAGGRDCGKLEIHATSNSLKSGISCTKYQSTCAYETQTAHTHIGCQSASLLTEMKTSLDHHLRFNKNHIGLGIKKWF